MMNNDGVWTIRWKWYSVMNQESALALLIMLELWYYSNDCMKEKINKGKKIRLLFVVRGYKSFEIPG